MRQLPGLLWCAKGICKVVPHPRSFTCPSECMRFEYALVKVISVSEVQEAIKTWHLEVVVWNKRCGELIRVVQEVRRRSNQVPVVFILLKCTCIKGLECIALEAGREVYILHMA